MYKYRTRPLLYFWCRSSMLRMIWIYRWYLLWMKLLSFFWRQASRNSKVPRNATDRQRLQEMILSYHCLLKVKAEMDQFWEGLSSLGVLQALTQNPSLMRNLFLSSSHKLTAGRWIFEVNSAIMTICYVLQRNWRLCLSSISLQHLHKRAASLHPFCWFLGCLWRCKRNSSILHTALSYTILHTCTDGDMKCWCFGVFLGCLDCSITIGFPLKPSLMFLYGEESRLAIASTCDLVLRIPTCHGKEYAQFNKWMELLILSNEFFERV